MKAPNYNPLRMSNPEYAKAYGRKRTKYEAYLFEQQRSKITCDTTLAILKSKVNK